MSVERSESTPLERGHAPAAGGRSSRKPESAKPELSVVIPVFNEEDCVGPLHREISRALAGVGRAYEILFVDDGSADGTAECVRRLAAEDPTVRLVRLRRNCGQTAAMRAGFDHAAGEVVVSMDGDLQNDPADIPRLFERVLDGYDVVCGWRKDRKDALIVRKVPSWIANRLIARLTGVRIHDNGCSLKAYRAETIKEARLYAEMHRFIPAITSISGASYTEMVVNHRARQHGTSKYGLSRTWRVLSDLLLVKMLVGFATRPGAWFTLLALPFFVIGLPCLVASVLAYASTPPGEPFPVVLPSAVALCAFAAGHSILLGMLGELILRTGEHRERNTIRAKTGEVHTDEPRDPERSP